MNCGVCNHREVCRCFPNPEEYCSDYEPERPHGEWKPDGTCSECGVYSSLNKDTTYFCPNCGADMRKEGEAE